MPCDEDQAHGDAAIGRAMTAEERQYFDGAAVLRAQQLAYDWESEG